jgi:flagellum-specific ATP synthase
MIQLGAYRKGSSVEVDEAIRIFPKLRVFLSQGKEEKTTLPESFEQLGHLLSE